MVAWTENTKLMIWTEEDTTPRQIAELGIGRPYIAPDGQHVAYITSYTPEGSPLHELWIVGINGDVAQRIVSSTLLTADGQARYIGQIAWSDDSILYFTTLRQQTDILQPEDDLWRANITTGEVNQLFAPGEGGSFSISPDQEEMAIIYRGAYGEPNGHVRLMNLISLEWRDAFQFAGVNSGGKYALSPDVFWEADSSALRVAIPGKDLLYHYANSPPTALWRLPVIGEAEQIGSIPASYFGLPRWSSDTTYMTYLQPIGGATSNRFALMVADGDGGDPIQYAGDDDTVYIGSGYWIPGTHQFTYDEDGPGIHLHLGEVDHPPRRLEDGIFDVRFVNSTTYIYATSPTIWFALRYARLNEPASTFIANVHNGVVVYDAVMITAQ